MEKIEGKHSKQIHKKRKINVNIKVVGGVHKMVGSVHKMVGSVHKMVGSVHKMVRRVNMKGKVSKGFLFKSA
ncbi:hypothetical protein POVCU2_0037700 [Plasmodium ovale curtisi]|uniref:Uncharacterized protein n=1 Tax=Plasmodium ovale curtisi TaxID=864141 RepID=A0A1A8W4D3_PLAOA|nr:hypothetical protein POVCU2_0037700 [Plasmodium ovale curtisi]